ncbi:MULTISPECIES: cobalamin biosynthesis protein [unclassified Vibrio]|uniref:Cobalamin biosynthesis protein n=1 Tax=Vibrio sp. HB236076 TaxID=3232307 RepID=A0AB39HBR0_9VIBR|nr:cobalamin biosynthesis protein [Vibrio sp. HB161653]MDP5254565.1 cobalamin biosynthesis protein [Vibrio sp. HB161653]
MTNGATALTTIAPALIVAVALIIHALLPIPASFHPITWWKQFAKQLSNKVNQGHARYQQFAGALAWAMMILPSAALLWAVSSLVWQQQLYQLALLLLALDLRPMWKTIQTVINALQQDDKQQARRQLNQVLNRDCDTLSALGIGKACAEYLIMGFGKHGWAVVFWFLFTGGIGALLYRLCSELSRVWSVKLDNYQDFGRVSHTIANTLSALPLWLLWLCTFIGPQRQQIWQQRQTWWYWRPQVHGALLASIGGQLSLSLAGPALYQGKKFIRVKLGGRIAPAPYHLHQLRTWLVYRIAVLIFLSAMLFIAIRW